MKHECCQPDLDFHLQFGQYKVCLTDCTTSPFLHTRSLIQGPAAPPLSWLLANPNPRVILPPEQTTILLSVDANILARSLWWYHRRNMKNVSCSSTSVCALCDGFTSWLKKTPYCIPWIRLSHVTRAHLNWRLSCVYDRWFKRRMEGVGIYIHSFLTLALDGGKWLISVPGRFTLGKEPRYPSNRKPRVPKNRSWSWTGGSAGFETRWDTDYPGVFVV